MPKQRTTSEPAPPSTDRPLRQIFVFLVLHLRDRGRDCPRATARRHHTAGSALPRHCSGSQSPWRLPSPAVNDGPSWRLLGFIRDGDGAC